MVKFKQPIYKGDKGRDVKAVKRALYRVGHHSVNAHTNYAGDAYEKALKAFQHNHKLDVDGVYGPKTHGLLEPHFDAYGRLLYRTATLRDPQRQSKAKVINFAKDSLRFAGRMIYTEGAGRNELFNRPAGDFQGAGADCSQFVSAMLNWSGVKGLNDEDATGTLLGKGRHVNGPGVARVVVFGPGAGVHAAFCEERAGGVWYLIEFGDQAAPDRVSLDYAISYFERRGEPGVRYLDFF